MKRGTDLGLLAFEHWGKHGVPVFPCDENKRPLVKWGSDATTDKGEILAAFARAGDRAQCIGAAMGEATGLFAVDFDYYKPGGGAQRYHKILSAAGCLPDTRLHTTRSGGEHYIYFCPDGMPVPRNSLPHNGVEIRGEGGYIIVPPTDGYAVVSDKTVEAPEELLNRLARADAAFKGSSIIQLKRKIIEADSFHEAAMLIAAKMSGVGKTPAQVAKVLNDAFAASVASNPNHERHKRWRDLVEGKDGELGRLLGSAYTKYNPVAGNDQIDLVSDKMRQGNRAVTDKLFGKKPEPLPEEEEPNEDEFPFAKAYNAAEVNSEDDKKFLVYPLIMESDVIVLSAAPKAGKTLTASSLALHMGAGIPFGDLTPVDADGNVAKIPVVYFALEGQGAIRKRVKAWVSTQDIDSADDLRVFFVEQAVNLAADEQKQAVVDKLLLADHYFRGRGWGGIGMVVFDTLTKAMPGKDQNSVEDTSAVFNTVDLMRESGLNPAVMFIHHNNKQGKGPRGSSNILAEPDTILSVDKVQPVVIDNVQYDCYQLDVFMARAIDDTQVYRMSAASVSLGKNSQGIDETAPVLTMLEDYSVQTTVDAATLRRRKAAAAGEFYGLVYQLLSQVREMRLPYMSLHRQVTSSGNELIKGFYASHINSNDEASVAAGWKVLLDDNNVPPSLGSISFSIDGNVVVMSLGLDKAAQA